MKEELRQFDIDIEDITENNDLIDNIHEAIHQMSLATMKDRFEVILNNNLINVREKSTNYRTIFGCRISYDNLPKDVSFIVREDVKPSYEKLEQENEKLHSIIKEVREWANKAVFYFDFEEEITKHAFDLLYTKQGQELLEILDKELKNKEEK